MKKGFLSDLENLLLQSVITLKISARLLWHNEKAIFPHSEKSLFKEPKILEIPSRLLWCHEKANSCAFEKFAFSRRHKSHHDCFGAMKKRYLSDSEN